MQIVSVYNGVQPHGIYVGEQCLLSLDGDFVGITTGTLFSRKKYYAHKQFRAIISSVDQINLTGLLQLDKWDGIHGVNNRMKKEKFLACNITVELRHLCDQLRVYWCRELNEYFSELELIVSPNPIEY